MVIIVVRDDHIRGGCICWNLPKGRVTVRICHVEWLLPPKMSTTCCNQCQATLGEVLVQLRPRRILKFHECRTFNPSIEEQRIFIQQFCNKLIFFLPQAQFAFPMGNPRRTRIRTQRAIYGWKLMKGVPIALLNGFIQVKYIHRIIVKDFKGCKSIGIIKISIQPTIRP